MYVLLVQFWIISSIFELSHFSPSLKRGVEWISGCSAKCVCCREMHTNVLPKVSFIFIDSEKKFLRLVLVHFFSKHIIKLRSKFYRVQNYDTTCLRNGCEFWQGVRGDLRLRYSSHSLTERSKSRLFATAQKRRRRKGERVRGDETKTCIQIDHHLWVLLWTKNEFWYFRLFLEGLEFHLQVLNEWGDFLFLCSESLVCMNCGDDGGFCFAVRFEHHGFKLV